MPARRSENFLAINFSFTSKLLQVSGPLFRYLISSYQTFIRKG